MGLTGVGKSLFARAMIQGADSIDVDDNDMLYPTGEPIIHNDMEVFKVS